MKIPGLFTDLYELTMAATYFAIGRQQERATFDLFVRNLPQNRGYLVFAGLPQVINYLQNLHFEQVEIDYLSSLNMFSAEFLDYLKNFKFSGDIYTFKEGEIFFDQEPIVRVTASLIEAQIIETALINIVQIHTLLASKASRVIQAARGKLVVDFGARRSQGVDASLAAAYTSYLVGAVGTSNVLAGQKFGIPVFGTMAHSFVQSFDSEEEAFLAFAKVFPKNTTFLIDTFNTIEGAKKSVKIAKKLPDQTINAVRIDSGDIVNLSKQVRKILDEGGLIKTKIFVSGDLDEYKIAAFEKQDLPIDSYGVGTRMDVSPDVPFLDIVYKLSQIEKTGQVTPKMKLSTAKQNLPGKKQVFRKLDKGKAIKDVIALEEESMDGEILLKPVIIDGQIVLKEKSWEELRSDSQKRLKRFSSFVSYPVEISSKLKDLLQKFTP